MWKWYIRFLTPLCNYNFALSLSLLLAHISLSPGVESCSLSLSFVRAISFCLCFSLIIYRAHISSRARQNILTYLNFQPIYKNYVRAVIVVRNVFFCRLELSTSFNVSFIKLVYFTCTAACGILLGRDFVYIYNNYLCRYMYIFPLQRLEKCTYISK